MSYYVYALPPVDHGWFFAKTVSEVAEFLGGLEAKAKADGHLGYDSVYPTADDFLRDWQAAQHAAQGAGWEGDFRNMEQRVVFAIPFDSGFQVGFVFKQDNNGTTFVVSPMELSYLSEYLEG
jgi:hypothetical protein